MPESDYTFVCSVMCVCCFSVAFFVSLIDSLRLCFFSPIYVIISRYLFQQIMPHPNTQGQVVSSYSVGLAFVSSGLCVIFCVFSFHLQFVICYIYCPTLSGIALSVELVPVSHLELDPQSLSSIIGVACWNIYSD